MMLWSDVNLDTVAMSPDGRSIQITLLNMDDGTPIANMVCSNFFHFSTQNNFQEEDGFACYVGEVQCDILEGDAIGNFLLQRQFYFSMLNGEKSLSSEEVLFWLHIEGGEIVLDIGCRTVFCDLN